MSQPSLNRVYASIDSLIAHAKRHLELPAANEIWVRNQIFALFGLDSYKPAELGDDAESPADAGGEADDGAGTDTNGALATRTAELVEAFKTAIVQAALAEAGDAAALADQVMGILSLDPGALQQRFAEIESESGSAAAMTWLYDYSVANNYVRRAQLDRNPRFDVGDLIVTINLAKPEFRSAASAKAGNAVAGGYPKCTICRENEGFAGRAKFTLRTVPVTMGGEEWFWQFSPYGYFDEHGIVVNTTHTPMHIDDATFVKLMDFVDRYPEYFIGSNAALPRIGGSVLGHDHYQGGRGPLPMHEAAAWQSFPSAHREGTIIDVLDWPGTAVRIVSHDRDALIDIGSRINAGWLAYEDREQGIIPRDGDDVFHAISPTVRKTQRGYEMSIILRSNITSDQYPEGVFHAHPEFHAIKQESIGLIEAQGLFILPARLEVELGRIKDVLVAGEDLPADLAEYRFVFDELVERVGDKPAPDVVDAAIRDELGSVCERILDNTAVFKDRAVTVDFLRSLDLI